MSKISKRRRAAGSTSDHAHQTVSESRCAQELEGHRILYDLASADVFGRQHRRSPRPSPRRAGRARRVRPRLDPGTAARSTGPRTHRSGCIRIFADKKSGKNAKREELRKASTTSARATPSSSPHSTGSAAPSTTSSRSSPACASAASASPRSTRHSTPPPRADAWSSTSSPHSRSSSANSSSRAPTKAWTQPAPAAPASAARRP